MKRRTFLKESSKAAAGLATAGFASAQVTAARQDAGAIVVDPTPLFELSPYLYMQFMEPLGATDGSVEAAWDHLRDQWREDVVEVTRLLEPPMMRWGGIFADFYRWREGVGPREKRPSMVNLLWGGVESNQVGTGEFSKLSATRALKKLSVPELKIEDTHKTPELKLETTGRDQGGGFDPYNQRGIGRRQGEAATRQGITGSKERDRTAALTTRTAADASSSAFIATALAALWVGAVGALLFALVAVVALVAALARARFGEVVVLRVVGVPAGLQARSRFAELAAAVLAASAVGVLVGAVTAFVTARELARASVAGAPAALPVAAHVDWLPWAVVLVAFLGLAAAIGAGAAASVRRVAARPGLREEER